uniref:Uncharacterized protein n=1 Tax=Trichuris muris TaxID=70415 RepID=A0A5S6QEG5_TRIMR
MGLSIVALHGSGRRRPGPGRRPPMPWHRANGSRVGSILAGTIERVHGCARRRRCSPAIKAALPGAPLSGSFRLFAIGGRLAQLVHRSPPPPPPRRDEGDVRDHRCLLVPCHRCRPSRSRRLSLSRCPSFACLMASAVALPRLRLSACTFSTQPQQTVAYLHLVKKWPPARRRNYITPIRSPLLTSSAASAPTALPFVRFVVRGYALPYDDAPLFSRRPTAVDSPPSACCPVAVVVSQSVSQLAIVAEAVPPLTPTLPPLRRWQQSPETLSKKSHWSPISSPRFATSPGHLGAPEPLPIVRLTRSTSRDSSVHPQGQCPEESSRSRRS